jgi:uncharacterized protein YbjT (DUF2867 family)
MNVLVCGSTGCVGAAVVAALRWRGHCVVETTRLSRHAGAAAMHLDFMEPVAPEAWAKDLVERGVDAVLNCVGILVPRGNDSFERVHHLGPAELFRGAAIAGVERVIQVSALGIDGPARATSDYLASKQRGDDALLALGIDGAVVRPSLVFGPRSASARLFATLASLPVIALPGRGGQQVQPIHVWELAEAIARLVDRSGAVRGIYELAGDSPISYRQMLADYRSAQHLGAAIWLSLPMPLMRLAARMAEWLPQRVYCRDTLALLEGGNVAARNAAPVLLGRAPSTLAEGLAATPAAPAIDLDVRLAPAVRAWLRSALAFLWIYTAAVSAIWPHESGVIELLARCGFTGSAGWLALGASCVLNTSLGVATLRRPSVALYAVQTGAVLGYTLCAALNVPQLAIDHCGPLAKNALLMASIAILWLEAAGRADRRLGPGQTSMLATRRALVSMKLRRGSTSSPISIVKTRSASRASSSWTRSSRRTEGSIVVSQS